MSNTEPNKKPNTLPTTKDYLFELTPPKSYAVKMKLGQGSLSIGTLAMDKKLFDVLIDDTLPVNWDCFNEYFTGFGRANRDKYPYGNFPRFFYYYGNDTGFIQWSEKRPIEDFTWCPQQPIKADFSKSQIRNLSIIVKQYPIEVILGSGTYRICVIEGNLDNIHIIDGKKVSNFAFYPKTDKDCQTPYQLPNFDALKHISGLDIAVRPLGQPFDCHSLLQFPNLTSLSLSGNITNLEVLSQFSKLEYLALRYAPNLGNLPSMDSWDNLKSFIGWNIEQNKGKLLRKELNQLKKQRDMGYSSVSQLRKAIWFTTEYGMPFSAWQSKSAKVAVKAYKTAVKQLKKADSLSDIQVIIEDFVKTFNDLPDIETSEREDIFEAVLQLIQVPDITKEPNEELDNETAIAWFDKVRDF